MRRQVRFVGHRAACPRSGRLRSRALGTERSLARVCREARAIVRCNTKLRDMSVHVPAHDERAIEVLASGGGHHPQKRSDRPGPRMSQRVPGERRTATLLRRCVFHFWRRSGSGFCQCPARGLSRPRWSLPGRRLLTCRVVGGRSDSSFFFQQ